jgi:hypothetical protein
VSCVPKLLAASYDLPPRVGQHLIVLVDLLTLWTTCVGPNGGDARWSSSNAKLRAFGAAAAGIGRELLVQVISSTATGAMGQH